MKSNKTDRKDLKEAINKEATKSAQKKSARKRFFRTLGLVSIVAGIAVMAYPLSTFLVTNRAQDELRSEWKKEIQKATHNGTTKSGTQTATSNGQSSQETTDGQQSPQNQAKIPAGKAAFRLMIPRIGLDMIVVEGTDRTSLKLGPGHMSRTVQPGVPGVCVVSAHRTTYGAPFFRLDRLQEGDEITIETATSRFVYQVFDTKVVSPNNDSFIEPAEESILALTTCTPIHSARQRLVVLAKQ